MEITVTRLKSGYYHLRGRGPCNWAQPEVWPCPEEELRKSAFPQASEEFIRAAKAKGLRPLATPKRDE